MTSVLGEHRQKPCFFFKMENFRKNRSKDEISIFSVIILVYCDNWYNYPLSWMRILTICFLSFCSLDTWVYKKPFSGENVRFNWPYYLSGALNKKSKIRNSNSLHFGRKVWFSSISSRTTQPTFICTNSTMATPSNLLNIIKTALEHLIMPFHLTWTFLVVTGLMMSSKKAIFQLFEIARLWKGIMTSWSKICCMTKVSGILEALK